MNLTFNNLNFTKIFHFPFPIIIATGASMLYVKFMLNVKWQMTNKLQGVFGG